MKVVLGRTGLGSMVGKEFGNTEVRAFIQIFSNLLPVLLYLWHAPG
jgi:hypothetical protein